jgi:hypothetical protein
MTSINALLLALLLISSARQDYNTVTRDTQRIFQVITFSYPGFDGIVKFWPTVRTMDAKGSIRVTRKSGTTFIDARVDDLPPASAFDGAFSTYVLWLISPEGKLENAGQFVLVGDGSELQTTTTWSSFGMFVTAEPNCRVQAPSQFVVLVNAPWVNGIWQPGRPAIIRYAPPEVSE